MIAKKQAGKAVDAVLALLKKEDGQVNITDQTEKIDVTLTLKRIPRCKHKSIPVVLPHTIYSDTQEVCVFVTDMDKKSREYEATVEHYEDLFRKNKINCISKVIPLKALYTDYSMHSAKRSLAKAYDLYLADNAAFGRLPGLLGKIFFEKKKTVPVTVNLKSKDLKKEIENVVMNTRCVLQGQGSSSCVTVATDKLSKSEILSNVLSVCNQLAEKVPGGKQNIRNIHLKGAHTTAVPIYMDFGGTEGMDLKETKAKEIPTYIDEITTVTNAKVKVTSDGYVQVIPCKEEEAEEGKDSGADVEGDGSDSSESEASEDEGSGEDGSEVEHQNADDNIDNAGDNIQDESAENVTAEDEEENVEASSSAEESGEDLADGDLDNVESEDSNIEEDSESDDSDNAEDSEEEMRKPTTKTATSASTHTAGKNQKDTSKINKKASPKRKRGLPEPEKKTVSQTKKMKKSNKKVSQ